MKRFLMSWAYHFVTIGALCVGVVAGLVGLGWFSNWVIEAYGPPAFVLGLFLLILGLVAGIAAGMDEGPWA